jgi:hypothetical protein
MTIQVSSDLTLIEFEPYLAQHWTIEKNQARPSAAGYRVFHQ